MTRFDEVIKNITVREFANLNVKLVILNNSEPYYLTVSTGRLYPMNQKGFEAAVKREEAFWSTEVEKKDEA